MPASQGPASPEPESSFGSGILGDEPPRRPAPPPPPPASPAPAPAMTGLPDLSAWGKTVPAPPPVPQEHVFEPGDDIGNRIDRPMEDRGQRPRRDQGDRRGRGGPRRRFEGGNRAGDRFGDRRRGFNAPPRERRPHIPGAPPPPTDLPGNPRVIARQDHPISRKNIDGNALHVLNRLNRAGFKAYLVGGGVRDLLLGLSPKDFDICTDAKPQEVKRLFGNCFIIGRRFRLCHVRFGAQIIEVATFRGKGAALELDEAKPDHGQTPLDENVFGTAEEDALRRDLTINGLFYDIGTFAIIDYVGGVEDIQNKLIRTIGEPEERFREDPVRMVRAARFAAKLGFQIEPVTRAAIASCRDTLAAANPSRMLEEWYRLLNRGAAERSIAFLQETGLLEKALPGLAAAAAKPWLAALDAFDPGFRPLPGALCVAGLFGARIEQVLADPNPPEGQDEGHRVFAAIEEDLKRLQVSRRDRDILLKMVLSQKHFADGAKPVADDHFAGRDYFPAALDFFELRSRALGLDLSTLPDWRKAEAEVPRTPLGREVGPGGEGAGGEGGHRRRRRRRGGRDRRGPVAEGAATAPQGHDLEQGPPPEVIDQLYARDHDDVPGWVDDAQPQ